MVAVSGTHVLDSQRFVDNLLGLFCYVNRNLCFWLLQEPRRPHTKLCKDCYFCLLR